MYWLSGRQTVRDQFGHVVAGCLGVGRGPTDPRPRAEATNGEDARSTIKSWRNRKPRTKVSSTQGLALLQ